MFTSPEEYQKFLFRIQDTNKIKKAILLPSSERIYNVDLNKRTIEAPEFLSVEMDHHAETIYFKMDRFYDHIDLTETVGLVQYINKNAKLPDGSPDLGHVFVIPFYDGITYKEENKILFPWCLEGPATAAAGPVSFSFRFYRLDNDKNFIYNLSTLPATSKILHGMNVITEDNENFPVISGQDYADLWSAINDLRETKDLYWIEIP